MTATNEKSEILIKIENLDQGHSTAAEVTNTILLIQLIDIKAYRLTAIGNTSSTTGFVPSRTLQVDSGIEPTIT